MILDIAIYIFITMELSNVLIMYFKPDFRHGNSMATFKAWERVKQEEREHLFARYLVRWVANCKLIFIVLLFLIALLGNEEIKLWAVVVTTLSIGVYFITLHPLIRRLDKLGDLLPAGYSIRLASIIGGFMALFVVALSLHFVFK